MTRKALVTQAELKRMAELANSESVTVEIERDGTIIRVMPFHPSHTHQRKLSREEQAELALEKFKAERDKRNGV